MGKGDGRAMEQTGDPDGRGDDQGVETNRGGDGVPDLPIIIAQQLQNLLPTILVHGDARNVIMNNGRRGCSYKEFLACNPREYDGKGGAIAYTRWIKKMESVQDMSGCSIDQKAVQISGVLTDEAVRNRSIKKVEKRGNVGEASKDKNGRDDNKRTRNGNVFATTVSPVRRENI
nr:hypothetical protein [Tanacetum cinerariifolium]